MLKSVPPTPPSDTPPEREFPFRQELKSGASKTIYVKESELTLEQTKELASYVYMIYNDLPGLAKDIFKQVIKGELIQDEIKKEEAEAARPKIITSTSIIQ